VIDFTKVDLRNPLWHKRLGIVIDEILRRDHLEVTKLMHRRSMTAMTSPLLDVAQYNKLAESEAALVDQYLSALYGGVEKKEDRNNKIATASRDAWERAFGKLDSPEVQKKIHDAALGLKHARQATQTRKIIRDRSGNTV
jgi:hypothetical protein